MSRIAELIGLAGRNQPTPAPTTERMTATGPVVGLIGKNGAHMWRGIPFAASTAGQNRWRAPRPAPAWHGTRIATEFAPRCAQLTNRGDEDEGIKPGLIIGSEDCLALDIYAPPSAQGQSLPVMVWIHGGGNVWGRSGMYDGSELAIMQDIIVVAVQYRLGLLGWFSHPLLRADTASADDAYPEDTAASFAILDQIASLRWVADNIAAFGGDPDCVTIFGESSGGHNTAALLASPLAKDLFHRAIIESGSFDSVSLAEAEGTEGSLTNPSSRVARHLGATTADQLRAATVEQLYSACEKPKGLFLDVPRMIQDGVVLPSGPLRDAFTSRETFNAVPIITGTTRDEMKLFYAGDQTMTEKKFGVLVVPRDDDFYDAKSEYLSRVWRARSVTEPAEHMAAAGHHDVYTYRFDWDDGGRLFAMDFKQIFGAAHGFELPFVFHRFEHLGDADRFLFQKRTLEDREQLSRAIGAYWASFARDGVPSCPGQPPWPRYGQGSCLVLDTPADGGIRVADDLDSVSNIVIDLRDDADLDEVERQSIVNEMDQWMFTRPIAARFAPLRAPRD